MQISQVAAQLYTIRDFLKTPSEIAQSMQKIRAIGYESVQVSGMGAIEESELNTILADNGLTCCATHESTKSLFETPQLVVERLQKLDCKYTAVPSPGGYPIETLQDVIEYSLNIERAGKALQAAGQVLTYHNHHLEFRKLDGKTILDHIYDSTDATVVQAEIDTYWVQFGDGDVVSWCEKLRNRLPLLHLKDYGITDDNKVNFCEVGQGNLGWKRIIAAAEKSGCEWFIVEQDTTPGDPFDSLRTSFDYIAEHLVS